MEYNPFDWYWIVSDKIWSSKSQSYVDEIPENAGFTKIGSESELDEVLSHFRLLGPTARRKILKSVVQARLIDAGKMDAAYAALVSNSVYFARWFAPDHPEVYVDDPDALILLQAIGADPEVIMAPEI